MTKIIKWEFLISKFSRQDNRIDLIILKETPKMYSLLVNKKKTKLPKGIDMIRPTANIVILNNTIRLEGHVYFEDHNEQLAIERLNNKINKKLDEYFSYLNDLKDLKDNV